MTEKYVQVSFIVLQCKDDQAVTNVPLYVRVNELNASGMTATEEKLIGEISTVMMRRYEKQISEHFQNLKQVEK